eukprot:3235454-Alexandrium_andersonii.AAC.1
MCHMKVAGGAETGRGRGFRQDGGAGGRHPGRGQPGNSGSQQPGVREAWAGSSPAEGRGGVPVSAWERRPLGGQGEAKRPRSRETMQGRSQHTIAHRPQPAAHRNDRQGHALRGSNRSRKLGAKAGTLRGAAQPADRSRRAGPPPVGARGRVSIAGCPRPGGLGAPAPENTTAAGGIGRRRE